MTFHFLSWSSTIYDTYNIFEIWEIEVLSSYATSEETAQYAKMCAPHQYSKIPKLNLQHHIIWYWNSSIHQSSRYLLNEMSEVKQSRGQTDCLHITTWKYTVGTQQEHGLEWMVKKSAYSAVFLPLLINYIYVCVCIWTHEVSHFSHVTWVYVGQGQHQTALLQCQSDAILSKA